MNLIPIILVASIGLIFGVVLTVAAKIMYVPVDPIVSQVRDQLPGATVGLVATQVAMITQQLLEKIKQQVLQNVQ